MTVADDVTLDDLILAKDDLSGADIKVRCMNTSFREQLSVSTEEWIFPFLINDFFVLFAGHLHRGWPHGTAGTPHESYQRGLQEIQGKRLVQEAGRHTWGALPLTSKPFSFFPHHLRTSSPFEREGASAELFMAAVKILLYFVHVWFRFIMLSLGSIFQIWIKKKNVESLMWRFFIYYLNLLYIRHDSITVQHLSQIWRRYFKNIIRNVHTALKLTT